MHRKSTAQKLGEDLRDLVDAVVPDVESAAHTVAEKAPPLLRESRAAAVEKGTHAAEALARRLPDPVVDRLPDTVADHLPRSRRRGRKALFVLAALGLVGVVGALAARRQQARPTHAADPSPYPRAVEEDELDPSDPLVEPRVDGTQP